MESNREVSKLLSNDKSKLFWSEYYQKLKALIKQHYKQSQDEGKELLIVLAEKHKDFTIVAIKEMINEIIKELSIENVYIELDEQALMERTYYPTEIATYIDDSRANGLNVIAVDHVSRISHDGSKKSMQTRDNHIATQINERGEAGFLAVGFEHMEGILSGKNSGQKLDNVKFHILAINIVEPVTLSESNTTAEKAPDEEREAIISRQRFYFSDESIVQQQVPDQERARAVHDHYDALSYQSKPSIPGRTRLGIYEDIGEISGHSKLVSTNTWGSPPPFTSGGPPPLTGVPSFSSSGNVPSFSSSGNVPSFSSSGNVPSFSSSGNVPSFSSSGNVPSFSSGGNVPSFSSSGNVPSFSSGGNVPSFRDAPSFFSGGSTDASSSHTYAEGASFHFFDRKKEPVIKNAFSQGISIHTYGEAMELIFNAHNLDKARKFLQYLPNEDNSDLTRLEDCIKKKKDFVIDYASLEALKDALAKIPSSHKQLKDELEILVAEYTGETPSSHWGS